MLWRRRPGRRLHRPAARAGRLPLDRECRAGRQSAARRRPAARDANVSARHRSHAPDPRRSLRPAGSATGGGSGHLLRSRDARLLPAEPYRTARRIAGRSTTRTIAISEHVRAFVERLGRSPGNGPRSTTGSTPRSGELGSGAGGGASQFRDRGRRVRGGGGLAPDFRQGTLGASDAHARASTTCLACGCSLPEMDRCAPSSRRRAGELGLDGRVRFLGFVADIRRFMAACDALAFPTHRS